MAHLYAQRHYGPYRPAHVHFLAALMLAAVVLVVTLTMRDYRAPPRPSYEVPTPTVAP